MASIDKIRELLSDVDVAKHALKGAEHRLADALASTDMDWKTAYATGIVRLNFAAPPGFKKFLFDKGKE